MADRTFDVILYGATGFTGQPVAQHLLDTYGVNRDLSWAIAGRNEEKLGQVRQSIGAPRDLVLMRADASDPESIDAMVAKSKVIISTVGPYQTYGDGLVAACAEAGTDYVDLTGESNWIAKMIPLHEAQAKASGARIVFSCGFDSIPFDCGALFTENEAIRRFGAPAPRLRARMRAMRGGISGGTIASGMATQMASMANPEIGKLLADPFALTPGFRGPDQPDLNATYEDKVTGAWVAPFMMSPINSKAVHRTNFLLNHAWGKDFAYDEMMMLPGPPDPSARGAGFNFAGGKMPKPGEGPSKEDLAAGFYDVLFIASYPDGRELRCSVKGDKDPGYASTPLMLGESAVCLAKDVPRSHTPGGCWTAAAAMGEALITRLTANAGMTFNVES